MTVKGAVEMRATTEFGPPPAWVFVDMAAARATGVLNLMRAQGPASAHFLNGRVTRVEAADKESLLDTLVSQGELTTSQHRAVLADIEQLDVTLAATLERHEIMSRQELDELRAKITAADLEDLIATGCRIRDFEEAKPDTGPVVEVLEPVVMGLVRAEATQRWMSNTHNLEGSLTRTEKYWKLRQHIAAVINEDELPASKERFDVVAERSGSTTLEQIAALVICGLLEVTREDVETSEELEQRAAGLAVTEEACRLLIRASESYEEQGDIANARRAALSALRRRPTLTAPLDQVERLCVGANEVATLELVYELVNGALPGPFGRRALLYRAGRLFELELADPHRAREFYRRSVAQVPESGAPLTALQRTSNALDDMRPVIDAYASIGLASHRPDLREEWLTRAAETAKESGYDRVAAEILAHLETPEAPEDLELQPGDNDAAAVTREEAAVDSTEDEAHPSPPPVPVQASTAEASVEAELVGDEDDGRNERADLQYLSAEDVASEVSSALDAAFKTELDSVLAGENQQSDESSNPSLREQRLTPIPAPPASSPPPAPGDGGSQRATAASPVPGIIVENVGPLTPIPTSAPQRPSRPTPPPETVHLSSEVEVGPSPVRTAANDGSPMTILAAPADEIRLRQLCTSFIEAPGDIQRIGALRDAVKSSSDTVGKAGVSSFLALFDTEGPPKPLGDSASLEKLSNEIIRDLALLPRLPDLLALSKLWRAAPQLLAKELADLGVGRAMPPPAQGSTPAGVAFNTAHHLIPSEASKILYLPAGPTVQVALTQPPSVLVGPGGQEDSPALKFRIARAVAMGHPELLLPCVLKPDELRILLMALQAAFGESPPRGSLDFAAASLAQDLWTAVPRSAQGNLGQLLGMRPMPEVEEIRDRALRSATLLATLTTGDAATALRVSVADDPFLSGADPTTEEGFVRALQRSPSLTALVRLALSPKYWELRLAGRPNLG